MLALSYIHREDEPTLSYRVLDQGEVVLSGMLVRRGLTVDTLKDLAATLRVEGWKTQVYVDYNACAAAVGCYVTQDKYDDVVFHAQAIGVADGEQGYVVAGEPLVAAEAAPAMWGRLRRATRWA